MKKILAILLGVSLLWACDPMEDTYQKLDDAKQPYKEVINYTLISTDYTSASNLALKDALTHDDSTLAKAIKSQLAFNERFAGKDYIPDILTKNFPALSKGSSANIQYDVQYNTPVNILDLYSNNIISEQEYKDSVWKSSTLFVKSFTPSTIGRMPQVLLKKFEGASTNAYRLVEYNYSEVEPTIDNAEFKYFEENFETHTCSTSSPYTPIGENGWTQKDTVTGSVKGIYYCRKYNNNQYAQITSNNTGEKNDVFLITKEIDLTDANSPILTFDVNVGYWNATCLSILISSNYTGDLNQIGTATWVDLTSNFTLPTTPTSGYGTFANAGQADISAFKGKKVYIAFLYKGDSRTTANPKVTTTYQIDNVKVSEIKSSFVLSETNIKKYWKVYKFNGTSWASAENKYVAIQADDYALMGKTYITSSESDAYVIPFLKLKYPFALEGDAKVVSFRSESNQTKALAFEYKYSNGNWTKNSYRETRNDQFLNDGTKWFYDPTVYFTPVSADYQLLVDWVYQNLDRSYGSSYGNDEFYYGASAYYSNWDLRLSKRTQYNIPGFDTGTENEKIALTWQRLEEGAAKLLSLKFPDAVSEISGFPVYYWIYLKVYQNDLKTVTYVGVFQLQSGEFKRVRTAEDAAVSQGKLTQDQVNWNRSN